MNKAPKPYLHIPCSDFEIDAYAVSTSAEGSESKLSILENVKNLIFLSSKIIFGQQIWTPEPSEMPRELIKKLPNNL